MLAALLATFAVVLPVATVTPAHAASTITIQAEDFRYAEVVNDNGTVAARVNAFNVTYPDTYGFKSLLNAARLAGDQAEVCFRWRSNNVKGTGGASGSIIGALVQGVQTTYITTCKTVNVKDVNGYVYLYSSSYSTANRRMFFDWVSVTY